MSIKDTNVIADEQIHLIDELQELLEKQIELAQKGEPSGKKYEELSKRMDVLVKKIVQEGIPESEQFKNRRKQLKKLYESLYPAIAAQKVETAKQLERIQKGKKTIAAYRKNI